MKAQGALGGDRRRLGARLSAAQPSGDPAEGGLTMGAIGDVVATRVILQDCKGLLLVQPLSVETGNEQTLDLRQGQRRGFFYSGA